MNENRILSASDFMSRFTNIDFSKSDRLTNVWKKVVSKISVTKFESENSEKRMSIGERLAGNTRVVDLKMEFFWLKQIIQDGFNICALIKNLF